LYQANTTLKAKLDILRANLEDTRAEADIAGALKTEVANLRAQLEAQQARGAADGNAGGDAVSSAADGAIAADAAAEASDSADAEPARELREQLQAARDGLEDATLRAEAAETAIGSLRAHAELRDEASAADVIDHVLRRLEEAQNHAAGPESPAEAPGGQAAALQRADELAAQLAEQERLRADAEERAEQLAGRLAAAEQEVRAAAAAAAAREDAARAADATLHAELEDAQRQVLREQECILQSLRATVL
jgi:DNA repair exonuclease SbcCD ATPase subunit